MLPGDPKKLHRPGLSPLGTGPKVGFETDGGFLYIRLWFR